MPTTTSQRRTFLDVLRLELRETHGLSSGVVLREGCTVLFVVSRDARAKSVEIACDMAPDGWWFAWVDDGRTIAPVEDTAGTARLIADELRCVSQFPCG